MSGTSSRALRLLLVGVLCAAAQVRAQDICAAGTKPPPGPPPDDGISDTRILRRIALSLTGTTPTVAQYEELLAAPTPEARQALLQKAVNDALASPRFYEQMVRFGHDWLAIGAYTTGAQGESYQGDMSGHLFRCPGGTPHAGKLYLISESGSSVNVCSNLTAEENTIEPWWAPGTTVTVVGTGGTGITQVSGPNGTQLDCGLARGGYYDPSLPVGCGCGPNLVWCSPFEGLAAGSNHDLLRRQRRHPYEEPARLFAHLAWHDRPLTDLVIGNYSVGTNWLRALYVRLGRQMGATSTDANTTWWQPAVDGSPRDPLHPTPGDPQAWREFVVEDLNPFLLSLTPNKAAGAGLDRNYQFDPRTTTAAPAGLPAAGVLTMMGSLSSFPRERVRAARFLEMFACTTFSPPSADQHFPPYSLDPATGGTCMHCHRTLDPAAIAFKRWDFGGASSMPPWPFIPGMGRYRITAEWFSGQYPHGPDNSGPGFRWKNAFLPNTVMTPVTPQEAQANPEALLLDTMPQSYSLLGQSGDGTMGPLGFGKILVRSGEFDRCAVRKLYARFVGRPLDPAVEKPYIDKLAREFVTRGRKLRPFLHYLFEQSEFRRGL
ncbi:MAG: DUF1549 domain-containing protein [Myxococcota bacterium]